MADSANSKRGPIGWVFLYAVAMALVEAAVVVYLRRLYYPEGFGFPLKPMDMATVGVELGREAATVVMLLMVGHLAGQRFWERFAHFIFAFGVWDISYYIWLKVFMNWPLSLLDWDILFLLPLPWIGPVIAPCSIAAMMIVIGLCIIHFLQHGYDFHPTRLTWILAIAATLILLYSFMRDLPATLHFQMPQPYWYGLLIVGNLLYLAAFIHTVRHLRKSA
jgi:hypothetical protein